MIVKNEETTLTPAESRPLVTAMIKLVSVVETMVEKGIEPLSTAVVGISGNTAGRGFAAAARRLNAPTAPPRPTPGKKKLIEALNKSITVLFGTNLGNMDVAHRGTLNVNFTADLRKHTDEKARLPDHK